MSAGEGAIDADFEDAERSYEERLMHLPVENCWTDNEVGDL